MALNAVLQHVLGAVNGLPIPGQQSPLSAKVVPPPVEPLSGPLGWITPGPMRGTRQTAPRGPGFTAPDWTVQVTLDLLAAPDDPDLDQVFYLAVDAVLYAIWGDVMPVMITDPVTGRQTQLLAIGEEYTFEPGNWVTTASNRLILFRGRITTTIKERLQTGAAAGGAP